MQTVLVSIIVTVYNVAAYIEKCLDSIVNQSYLNTEIIIVDDGSNDDSSKICDNYGMLFSNIQVIHKINAGSVNARRDGLNIAKGRYVIFLDGDDYIDRDYIKNMVESAISEKADLVIDSYVMTFPTFEKNVCMHTKKGVYEGNTLEELKCKAIYSGEYYTFGINPSLWNKMFVREKIYKYFYDIPSNLSLGDDFVISMPYIFESQKIVILDSKDYYHYRQHNNSMIARYDEHLVQKINCLIEYVDIIKTNNRYWEKIEYYYSLLLLDMLKNTVKSKESIKKQLNTLMSVGRVNEAYSIVKHIKIKKISMKYKIPLYLLERKHYLPLFLILRLNRRVHEIFA